MNKLKEAFFQLDHGNVSWKLLPIEERKEGYKFRATVFVRASGRTFTFMGKRGPTYSLAIELLKKATEQNAE